MNPGLDGATGRFRVEFAWQFNLQAHHHVSVRSRERGSDVLDAIMPLCSPTQSRTVLHQKRYAPREADPRQD